MEQTLQPKWEGKVSTRLTQATADQIWTFFKDFFNLHKWFPSLATSYGVHGTNGEPGCIRYCAGSSIPSNDGNRSVSWSKERLIAIDHDQRSLAYEIVDSNIGFKSYVSTVKIVPEDQDGRNGCLIEWSFTVDPVERMEFDELVKKYDLGLQRMARKMEDSVLEEKREPKWEGKASIEIASLRAEQVWPCLEDFCNLHQWFPTIDTCYQVEGVPGQPGLIRYCASTDTSSSNGTDDKTTTKWVKEKLVMIDPIQQCLSYEVIDNNMGFKSYVATLKVSPINGGDGNNGCMIEWSFVADPIEGWRSEDLASYIDYTLQVMAKKMENFLLQTGSV